MFEDFVGGVVWQFVEEDYFLWYFVVGKMIVYVLFDGVFVEVSFWFFDYECVQLGIEFFIVDVDCGGFYYVGMFVDQIFDFGGKYVFIIRDDYFVVVVVYIQQVVFVEVVDVVG